jgi:putative copper export protein
LLIGAQAVNSHAAGSLVMPWNAILVHWLHALSVAFWVGGIIALTFVLPVAMRPYEGDARWQAPLRSVRIRGVGGGRTADPAQRWAPRATNQ